MIFRSIYKLNVVQRYSFLHKIDENENIFVLNFAKSNNL
uniref:Uncharacterized protein n=1 Tax=virus sp. ctJpG3 TaxID=2825812 RepID=A0A8S5RMM0_9VIRU|nr:MAG TPA: Protein of unknown function (DUF3579) [virus sp. ctJpG3]